MSKSAIDRPPNGPAFPHETDNKYYPGMMLRDYIATAAMQGLLMKGHGYDGVYGDGASKTRALAKLSFEIADAMLEARQQ
jgi:hypothetical protein